MDSDSTLLNAVAAETTPIGAVHQAVCLAQNGRGRGGGECITERDNPRCPCANYRSVGHARQVPSRPPDHQLPVRHGHDVRCREAIIRPERLFEASYGVFAGPTLVQGLAFVSKMFHNR